uniref:hypothetical protein n=1 Tax=Nonomuraea bangladeshensis TaxID=404385 RepID=UPI003F49288E
MKLSSPRSPGGEPSPASRPVTSCPGSYDVAAQRRLGAVSEDLTGVTFPVAAPASGAAVTA